MKKGTLTPEWNETFEVENVQYWQCSMKMLREIFVFHHNYWRFVFLLKIENTMRNDQNNNVIVPKRTVLNNSTYLRIITLLSWPLTVVIGIFINFSTTKFLFHISLKLFFIILLQFFVDYPNGQKIKLHLYDYDKASDNESMG